MKLAAGCEGDVVLESDSGVHVGIFLLSLATLLLELSLTRVLSVALCTPFKVLDM